MKKTISFLLSVIMLLSLTLTGCAAEETQVNNAAKIILQIGNPNMTVNGTEKPIDENGTAPVIINDRTLLPVRAVVEEMGGTVGWDGGTQTITLNYGADEINLVIDETTAYLNGIAQTLDTAPIIPYCSMGGGRFGQTISAISKLNPNSAIKEGLDVSYSSYDREEISRWLEKNNISVKN